MRSGVAYLIMGLNKVLLKVTNKRFIAPNFAIHAAKHETAEILNSIIESIDAGRHGTKNTDTHYLEIGVWQGYNLERINASSKTGVDPEPKCWTFFQTGTRLFRETSDHFFGRNHSPNHYSLVFIDGLHDAIQVYRDLKNSMRVLTHDGAIVLDDVWPENSLASKRWTDLTPEEKYEVSKHSFTWRGDVYKVLLFLVNEPFFIDNVTVELLIHDDIRKAVIRPKIEPVLLAQFLDSRLSKFFEYEMIVRDKDLWKRPLPL